MSGSADRVELMPVQFKDFVAVASVPEETIVRFQDVVEPAVVDLWRTQGYGMAAGGFIKVVDPDYYLHMIGEFLPRDDMLPLFATGLGDVIVAYHGSYRVLQFRLATFTGLGNSVRHFGTKAADTDWLEESLSAKPYEEAARMYGALTSFDDYEYIYAYKLPLPAGGPEGVQYLTRARIFEHIAITEQLAGPIPFAG